MKRLYSFTRSICYKRCSHVKLFNSVDRKTQTNTALGININDTFTDDIGRIPSADRYLLDIDPVNLKSLPISTTKQWIDSVIFHVTTLIIELNLKDYRCKHSWNDGNRDTRYDLSIFNMSENTFWNSILA